jgi:hypothetical protein
MTLSHPADVAENGCHDCTHFIRCNNHMEFEMKKKYSHHAVKEEGVSQVTPTITNDWLEMVIAATIGPNLALYSMSDPEGPQRMEQFKVAIKNFIIEAYITVVKEDDFDVESFVATAQSVILIHFGKFVRGRFSHLLMNGMPSKPVIIKPH